METDKYYAEIANQAALLKQDPARFHSSVRSWILLGYILLFFVLIALVAMLVIAIFLYRVPKLAFFVGAAGFIGLAGFVMAMFTKYNDTNAIEFNRAEAPEIWKRLDHFCQKAGLKKVDKLLLDDDFNASASLQGRFIFGPQKVVVTLGVPFLSLHSPEEVDAVLVHELAHHINKDTNISHRSYRIGLLWGGLAENSSGLTKWIDWLATWYWRTLSAKRDVSSRPAEFAADKLAAEIVGQEAMQGTLVRTPVNATTRYQVVTDAMAELARRGEPIEPHYATNIHKLAKVDMEDPPFDEIIVELRKQSHENDSHPSLRERLANIGVNIDPEDLATVHNLAELYAAPLQTTALEAYFPGTHTDVLQRFDKQFVERYTENWKLMGAQGKEENAALQELEEKRSTAPLTLEEELKYLELKAESNQLKSVAEEVTALYQNHPDNKEVLTLYARLKLEQKDPTCLDLLKRLETDPEYRLASFSLASNYYSSIGDSQNERVSNQGRPRI